MRPDVLAARDGVLPVVEDGLDDRGVGAVVAVDRHGDDAGDLFEPPDERRLRPPAVEREDVTGRDLRRARTSHLFEPGDDSP